MDLYPIEQNAQAKWNMTIQRGLLDKFKYCDSNVGLSSIAPPLVMALPTIVTAIVVALNCS